MNIVNLPNEIIYKLDSYLNCIDSENYNVSCSTLFHYQGGTFKGIIQRNHLRCLSILATTMPKLTLDDTVTILQYGSSEAIETFVTYHSQNTFWLEAAIRVDDTDFLENYGHKFVTQIEINLLQLALQYSHYHGNDIFHIPMQLLLNTNPPTQYIRNLIDTLMSYAYDTVPHLVYTLFEVDIAKQFFPFEYHLLHN